MGSGFKTFTAGAVLTASDVNNYLMEQSVMVFATAAARTSAISSPEVGMTTYRKDAGIVEVYYGATTGWKPPWPQPWGVIDRKVMTSGSQSVTGTTYTTISDGTVSASITFTPIANRLYRLTYTGLCQVNFASAGSFNGRFYKGANVLQSWAEEKVPADTVMRMSAIVISSDMGTTSETFTAKFAANAGGVTVVTYFETANYRNGVFLIEDIGPSTTTPPAS